MNDIKWSPLEKKLAREVFESALQNELAEIIAQFKSEAAAISEPEALWAFIKHTDHQREEIDRKYDFRYSQLLHVFGHLLREGRISEDELQGLSEQKMAIIQFSAGLDWTEAGQKKWRHEPPFIRYRVMVVSRKFQEILFRSLGRRDWTRTNDPHHVKVVL